MVSKMREMKDTGIEWIGEIPKNWNIVRNKYLFRYIKGQNPTSLNSEGNGLPYIGASDIESSGISYTYSNFSTDDINRCSKQDTLVLWDGARAGAIGIGHEGLISSTIVAVRPYDAKVHKKYLYWYLKAFQPRLLEMVGGTTIPHMSRDYIERVYFLDVSSEEQQKIASYLDQKVANIENIIEKTKESIEEYRKLKQSIITETVTKGLNPNVEMKDSEIEWQREIPEHWQVVNPKRLFELRKEKALEEDEQLTASQKHGILLQKDFMEIEGQKVVTVEKDFDILKHVEPNDFVISMRSFQGGLEYSSVRGCISSAYVMIIPKDGVYPPYYRWLFKSSKYINALQSTSNLIRDGQAMRFSNFIQIPLFKIPLDEQRTISEYLEIKTKLIDSLIIKKVELLSEIEFYKKSLIYEVVTGKKGIE